MLGLGDADVVAAARMADQHVSTTEFLQAARRDLARVRTGAVFGTAILRTQSDRSRRRECRDRLKVHERREDRDIAMRGEIPGVIKASW